MGDVAVLETVKKHRLIKFPVQDIPCRKCGEMIEPLAKYCKFCGAYQDESGRVKYQPKKKFEVYPFKDMGGKTCEEWIEEMQKYLLFGGQVNHVPTATERRNYILFTVGIDIGLRASDLLKLKVSDFVTNRGEPKSQTRIIEQKTGKTRDLFFNAGIMEVIVDFIRLENLNYNDYIFKSPKTNKPIQVRTFNNLIHNAGIAIGYPLSLGSHSLRKTFGYRIYTAALKRNQESGYRALSILSSMFNHSSTTVTLHYIGITEEEKCELATAIASSYDMYKDIQNTINN